MIHKTGRWIQRWLYPGAIWSRYQPEKVIYLTFDDGPVPEATPYVLQELEKAGAKATFFCVGDNIRKYPQVLAQVVANGHQPANHTFNHLNGWKTPTDRYWENTLLCQQMLDQQLIDLNKANYPHEKPLFRPPYGRMKPTQHRLIREQFRVVLWDVLSWDFDRHFSAEWCLKNTIAATEPGSIVVFHDSVKMLPKLQYMLPRYLGHFAEKGYVFKTL